MNQIKEYDEFAAKLSELEDACNFLPDMTTDDGYGKSKRISLDVGKVLTRLEKTRKDIKEPALLRCNLIDSEARAIKQKIEAAQQPHKEAYKGIDELNKKREERRVQGLTDRVDAIANLPENMRDSHSSEVLAAMQDLQANECLDFYDQSHDALSARKRSLDLLGEMFTSKLKAEKEAAELDRLRKEAAEREQKEREDRIAREATEAAEKKAAADKQAAINAERAEQERIEQERKDAVAAQEQAEIRAKLAVENSERKAAEAVERERQAVEAQKAKESAEAKAREENKKHRAAINNEALTALRSIGLTKEQATAVVTAIAKREVPHISIQY